MPDTVSAPKRRTSGRCPRSRDAVLTARREGGQAVLQIDRHLDGNGFLGHGQRLTTAAIFSSHIMTIGEGSCNISTLVEILRYAKGYS
jgi:hypothetical protein